MNPRSPVWGVLGLCWVVLSNPTRVQTPYFMASRTYVLRVLGSRTRACARQLLSSDQRLNTKNHASPKKLNKPNTLNTVANNPLISLRFKCVGFVLGWLNVCWVSISRAWA